MVELVFALLLIQDHKIVEHRIKDSLSELYSNASSQRQTLRYTWGKRK